jgi:hypothetical protein
MHKYDTMVVNDSTKFNQILINYINDSFGPSPLHAFDILKLSFRGSLQTRGKHYGPTALSDNAGYYIIG